MDNSILNILKDGSSFVVLILIIWYSMAKGIPFFINKLSEFAKEAIAKFSEMLDRQNETYKDSLDKITSSFTSYMDKSMTWHEKHSDQLNRVENKLDNLKK